MQWVAELPTWAKIGIGTAGFVFAVGFSVITESPLVAAGAVAGALNGGIEASLSPGAGFADIYMSAGIGAAFGAVCPWGAFGALAGGFAFAGARAMSIAAFGGDPNTIATAYQWGSLLGGLAGDAKNVVNVAREAGARRALTYGLNRTSTEPER
jgi:hypothetical protein